MEMTVHNFLAKIKTKFNICGGKNHVIDTPPSVTFSPTFTFH